MDFLEHQHIQRMRNPRIQYRYRERRNEALLNNLGDREFRSHFCFSKEKVLEIAETLNENLG